VVFLGRRTDTHREDFVVFLGRRTDVHREDWVNNKISLIQSNIL
jgi:hypothetical protein